MSRHAYDFLTESLLWRRDSGDDAFTGVSERDLAAELIRYREHILSSRPSPSSSLAVAMSARDLVSPPETLVKRSVLYFDDVLIPDPVFHVSAQARPRTTIDGGESRISRPDLVKAIAHMRRLLPLVTLGRVRFVPSTKTQETPTPVPLIASDDHYASMVPEELRPWFRDRVRVKKIIATPDGNRRVTSAFPDGQTTSIRVDFGQEGPVQAFLYWELAERRGDLVRFIERAPPSEAALAGWIEDSHNRAAGGYLQSVIADVREAHSLGASLVTSCKTTTALLETIAGSDERVEDSHQAALELRLPIVEAASISDLVELIEGMPEAFKALQIEIKAATDSLASIGDAQERDAQAKQLASSIGRTQVHEVERKIHEAKRRFRWEVPVTVAQLAAGAFGLTSGNPSFGVLSAGLATGTVTLLSAAKRATEHRAMPGYFLWRLSKRSHRR